MFVPMCFFVGSLTYAIAVNFVPYYKKTVDAMTETDIGLQAHSHTADEEVGQEEKSATAFEHKE
jgi:FHS family L-fucose permease-like MFS transporter